MNAMLVIGGPLHGSNAMSNNDGNAATPRDGNGNGNGNGDDESVNSHEKALCEMLGLTSLECHGDEDENDENDSCVSSLLFKRVVSEDFASAWFHNTDDETKAYMAQKVVGCKEHYERFGYCQFDRSLSIPAAHLRRLTEQLVWSQETAVLRTFETITTTTTTTTTNSSSDSSSTTTTRKRCLTRLEHFCHQEEWKLVADHVGRCLSLALQEPMVLYKEKLNLKPPGGSGFAPHLDTPSLLQLQHHHPQKQDGWLSPTEFVTVMVAIDAMTPTNGCLRIVPGPWTRENAVETVAAGNMSSKTTTNSQDVDGDTNNPDGGGRQGLIPSHIAETLDFVDLPVAQGGDMVAFSGYVPHRSAANASHFARRAVFFTYNPARQGEHRHAYYERMRQLRDHWRYKTISANSISKPSINSEGGDDEHDANAREMELQALKSIPRI